MNDARFKMEFSRQSLLGQTSFTYQSPERLSWAYTEQVPMIGWSTAKKQYYRCLIDQNGKETWEPISPEQVPSMIHLRVLRDET